MSGSESEDGSGFDPERFEAEKYRDYFTELQQAYKSAFDRMNDRYDSTLVHAVDQQVLAESEPFYEDGRFRVEFPEDPSPADRVEAAGVVVDESRLSELLERYREVIDEELRAAFGLADGEGYADEEKA
ncbi:hypothetical protein BRC93_06425 [Halobacteriales archaeon QS_5_70_15]|nr:MAG: hypothetical protein BRC93_06425 [Halobacteriales archaeon QS_5_70_15]